MSEPIQELRLLTPLDRGRIMALGAVLATAGISLGCRETPAPEPPPVAVAIYGAPAPPLSAAPSAEPPSPAPPATETPPPGPSAEPVPPRPVPTMAPAYGGPPRTLTPEPKLKSQ